MKKIVNILFLVALAFSGAFACDSCEAFVISIGRNGGHD